MGGHPTRSGVNTTHANFHLPDMEAKCTPFGRTNIVEVVDGFAPPKKRESNVVSPCFLQGSGNAVKYQIWMMHLYVHFFSLPPCFETCSFSLLYLHSLSRSLEPWRSQTFAEQVIHISNTGSWDSNMGPTLRSCSEKCGKMWGFNVAPLCP